MKTIRKRAWWVAFVWYRQEEVSAHLFGVITAMGKRVFYLVRGIALLVLYRHHVEADRA